MLLCTLKEHQNGSVLLHMTHHILTPEQELMGQADGTAGHSSFFILQYF